MDMKRSVSLFFLVLLFMLVFASLPNGAFAEGRKGEIPKKVKVPPGTTVDSEEGGPVTPEPNAGQAEADVEADVPPRTPVTNPDGRSLEAPVVNEGETPSTNIGPSQNVRLAEEEVTAGSSTEMEHRGKRRTNARDVINLEQRGDTLNIGHASEIENDDKNPLKAKTVKNFEQDGEKISIETAEDLEYGNIKAKKVKGFTADGTGAITIEQADRIELPDGILTQIRSYAGTEINFHIGQARDILLGCIAMRQVWDSGFTINENDIVISPGKGVEFDIADCGFSQNHFKAYGENSKITISKSKRAQYELSDGELKCRSITSSETIQTNTSAAIQYGSQCFSCLDMSPGTIYWYNDENYAKDLGILVPKVGQDFKLCLKKQTLDYFAQYDGLLDFVDKGIVLTKVVEMLKYPFIDNQPASLLMDTLTDAKGNFRLQMHMDDDFTFITDMHVSNIGRKTNASNPNARTVELITNPNNYLRIIEKTVGDETHRLAWIDYSLMQDSVHQSRISKYESSYFEPKIEIEGKEAAQRTALTGIFILEPGHNRIEAIVD